MPNHEHPHGYRTIRFAEHLPLLCVDCIAADALTHEGYGAYFAGLDPDSFDAEVALADFLFANDSLWSHDGCSWTAHQPLADAATLWARRLHGAAIAACPQ